MFSALNKLYIGLSFRSLDWFGRLRCFFCVAGCRINLFGRLKPASVLARTAFDVNRMETSSVSPTRFGRFLPLSVPESTSFRKVEIVSLFWLSLLINFFATSAK